MKREISAGTYRHFNGRRYEVLFIAQHSETREYLVIYKELFGMERIHAMPLEMFKPEVDHEKHPEIEQEYVFERERYAWERMRDAMMKRKGKPDK